MKKESRRSQRVADLVQAEIASLLLLEAHDPEIKNVTITDVEMPPDLRSARVYFSVLGSEQDRERAREGLARAASFLRREVGRRCGLRYAPDLAFYPDSSLERGARIEELLAQVLPQGAEETAESAQDSLSEETGGLLAPRQGVGGTARSPSQHSRSGETEGLPAGRKKEEES